MKESNPSTEPIGQNLIKLITNLCFSGFVFSVLIFTVIAITYQPPDPWLESATALTKFLTNTENATFKDDSSVLKTGEDLQSMPVAPYVPPVSSITETVIEKSSFFFSLLRAHGVGSLAILFSLMMNASLEDRKCLQIE